MNRWNPLELIIDAPESGTTAPKTGTPLPMNDPEFDRILKELRVRCRYILSQGLSPMQVTCLGAELEAVRDEVLHTYVQPRIWNKP